MPDDLSPPLPHARGLRQRLRRALHPVRFGMLRGVTPLSREWGFDRGTPVDRYYIEAFLAEHRADLRGRVLEVKDDAYTRRFGGDVERAEVLDVDAGNPAATLVADLAAADHVAGDQFDCFVLTQTLQLIYDLRAAVHHAHRLLRRGGVLLVTVPVVSRIVSEAGPGGDYWRFTAASCRRLFGDVFGDERVAVRTYGNVFAGVAFLAGAAGEELPAGKLAIHDPDFPLIVGVRAVKG